MAGILRGDIRWADLNPTVGREQAGHRPVLVLSHDVFNERSGTVIAVALTSREPRAGFPLTCELSARGLPKRTWAKINQIRTLSIERLGKRLARLPVEQVDRIVDGLNEIIT
jgi:mRNA interferase MazF